MIRTRRAEHPTMLPGVVRKQPLDGRQILPDISQKTGIHIIGGTMCDEEEMYEDYYEQRSLPILGEEAPAFEAVTTHGPKKLEDYRGQWVVLFSHPADFTPVCTTEFMAFAGAFDELKSLNAQLIGLSIDSVHSHIAWVRNIEEKFGVRIPFPVIADLDMNVARMYGMIHPGQSTTAAVRAVFFIDPEGILRAMIYYPLSNGRYIPEIIRLVRALQMTDEKGVATPANWQPGDKVVVPPPATQEAAEKRLKEGFECRDWYLCFREP